MKKTFKFLTVFLLALLGANLQPAWAWDWKNSPRIYFDNSITNYSNVTIILGNDSKSACTQLDNIANTKLYTGTPNYSGMNDGYFLDCSGWGSEDKKPSDRRGYASNYTGNNYIQMDYDGSSSSTNYVFVPQSDSKGCALDRFQITYSSSIPATLNKTITIKATVDGTATNAPGKLTASSYTFSAYATCGTSSSATLSAGSSSTTCTVGYTANTTLTAVDVVGYTFDGWYNGSTKISSDKSCTVNPIGGETYYAAYTAITYYLKKSNGSSEGTKVGTFTKTGTGTYTCTWTSNTSNKAYFYVSLSENSATDNANFLGSKELTDGTSQEVWLYGTSSDKWGDAQYITSPYDGVDYVFTFTIGEKYYIKCDYPDLYTGLSVTKIPSAGSTNNPIISKTYVTQGQSVNVEAKTAATGYKFDNWTSSKGTFGTATNMSTTFTPNADNAQAVANYSLINYTITYDPETPVNFAYTTAPTSKTYGQSVEMTFTPASNYVIASVTAYKTGDEGTTVDVTRDGETNNYSFTQPAYDVTVEVSVSLSTVTVTYGKVGNGSIIGKVGEVSIGDSPAQVNGGSTVVFTATPDANYTVEGWYDNSDCTGTKLLDGDNTGAAKTYTIANIDAAKTVYVKFVETKRRITVATGTGVSSVSLASTEAYVVTASEEISATLKVGYKDLVWNLGSGITPATNYTTSSNPIKVNATSTGTITATATPKTYTVSFDNNGGTGTTPGNVTATYDAAMPALQDFTAPVKNGYKFLGYYYNNVQYYTATGTSARTWDVDDNVTLTAKWDQIHVYIEGKFRVRATGGAQDWVTPGSSASDYVENSKNIEFNFDAVNNVYTLNTWAYVDELAAQVNSQDLNFHIATCVGDEGTLTQMYATADGYNFWFNKDKESNMSAKMDGNKNLWFHSNENNDFSGPVILTYDPTENTLSYTAAPEQTYTVTFIAGGHGHLNEEGPRSVGVRSGYKITATPDARYYFNGWTLTGGAHMSDSDLSNPTNANVTVDGNGTVTANFINQQKIYFKKPSSWSGSEVYVYFYEDDNIYWNHDKSPADGNVEKGPKSKNVTGNQMTKIQGSDNVYYFAIPSSWGTWSPHKAVAFVNDKQDDVDAFYSTSVAGRTDFNKCTPYFISEGSAAYYNKYKDDEDNMHQTAYYSGGYWTSYDETEYYLRGSFNDWAGPRDEYRFKATSDPNIYEMIWPVSELNGELFKFKVWQTCDCWYGKQNTTINTDGQSINLDCNTSSSYDISFTPWKVGSYEFKLDISTMNLKVNFLDDIVVEDFPQEISVLNSRQYKITPNVRFFNGTKLEDIAIQVVHSSGSNNIATYTQSGTNLIVLGDATNTGQETVTVYYKKGGETIQTRTLVVNVANPITIQADMSEVAATETHWTRTDLVHIHFWGTDADKSQDAQMTYNETGKVYSVTVPKILGSNGQFNFIIWYGESLNMLGSDNAKWRQTDNIETSENTCYTMGAYTKDNEYRVATPKAGGGLCESGAYQIEISMKNGNTYLSNIVTTESTSKTFSFFAPKDNDVTYKGGTVRLLMDGGVVKELTGFSQAGVYVADLNGNDITTPALYEGDYYVIAGVSGSELNDDTKMHKFTPRANTAEDYSYYWTVYSGDCTDKNVIAKVANEYNSNLSLTIGADALTQSDGTVAAGNVRFSYEPTTNAFKRAILGASNSNDFLNVYGNNVYADADATQPLSESQDLSLSKFTDNSDWVYEKVVYVKVESADSESKVTLKSVFNGQTSHLLGYEIDETTGEEKKDSPNQLTVLGKGSTTDASAYAIRISYDFKKNRLISSWEPTATTYNSDMAINSDILFIRTEDGDVQQVQVGIKDGGTESYKISSLQHVMFVMEIDGSTDKTSYSQYWISLPFDCQISDIFGVEGYITLDENRVAQKGTWGIMRYRGDLRAQKGWFKETDGFWEWMYENETMYAGEGYVLFFERKSITSWPTIKVGDEDKTLKRLYFPSAQAGFVMSNTVDAEHSQFECKSMRCNIKTPEDREAYDSNWRVIGPKSYNNITAQTIQTDNPYGTQTQFPNFLYTYDTSKPTGQKYVAHDGKAFDYQSFHAYMVQYEGTITWMPYTQTTPPTVAARNVENSDFKGGTLTIELMQNDEQLDRTFVKLDEKGTTGFDFSQDMTKITENCAQIASVSEDVLYAGNTLPLDIELVPLNVKVTANGTYDIALAQSLNGLEVRLYDAFEQTTTPLDMMSATVTLNKGEYKDRFYLQLKQKGGETPTSFDGKLEQYNLPTDKTQKLLINDNIYLINAGRIYNVLGVEE